MKTQTYVDNGSEDLLGSVVLLSDLHFGPRLRHADIKGFYVLPKLNLPRFAIIARHKIEKYFKKHCGPHDFNVVSALPAYLNYVKAKENIPDFDFYLLLGDLVTWPLGTAYKLLVKYLTDDAVYDQDSGSFCKGLNIPTDKLAAIPGNHDKMCLKTLDYYNSYLSNPLRIARVPESSLVLIHRTFAGLDVLFILIDGNAYQKCDNLTLDHSFRSHLACGRIDDSLIDNLKTKLSALETGKSVDGISINNFQNAIRILLVHYAADVMSVSSGPGGKVRNLVLPHDCFNIDKLISTFRNQIDLLIHGHLHQPKVYAHNGMQVLAATTTTQIGGYNGFYVLKIFPSGLEALHYRWLGNDFGPDPDHKGVFPFYRLRPPTSDLPPQRSGPGSLTLP